MPTFTGQQVTVTAQTLTMTLTLEQLRDALAEHSPQATNRSAGWGSTMNTSSNINVQNGTPPADEPSVIPADDVYPERLAARYYYWEQRRLSDGVHHGWFLDAVDVIVSVHDNRFLVLWSSHDEGLISVEAGDATRSLRTLAHGFDGTRAELSGDSPLVIAHDDIYLWLTSKADRRESLTGGVHVYSVEAVTAGENSGNRRQTSRRRGVLNGAVDLSRVSFLTAVATESSLGPAAVTLATPNDDDTYDHVSMRLWRNSQFKILTSASHFRGQVFDNDQKRLELVQALAYRYIPLIISDRLADNDWSNTLRDELILTKQVELARVFRALAESNPLWAAYSAERGGDVFGPDATPDGDGPTPLGGPAAGSG